MMAGAPDAESPPGAGELSALDAPLDGDGVDAEALSDAAASEAHVSEEHEYGRIGRPINRRNPFYIAFSAAFGAALAFVVIWAVFLAREVLLLLGLSLFVAAGLDPVVAWLRRRGLPRWLAVLAVVVGALVCAGGVGALVVPVVTSQVKQLVNHLPHYEAALGSHSSFIGKLNQQYHVVSHIKSYLTKKTSTLASGIIGVGRVVVGLLLEVLIVVVVSIYLLADLPRVKRVLYQLAPRSRRARVVLLGDEMFSKVGGYVLGNVFVSLISGLLTFAWSEVFGIPYPLLLGVVVGIFDLVPIVGSTVGGVIVALVALTVSVPVAVATVGFYVFYRLLEDYVLVPRVMGRTVRVPGVVTVIATLVGGALLGIVGALVAIPVAAALKLLVEEVSAPSLERR